MKAIEALHKQEDSEDVQVFSVKKNKERQEIFGFAAKDSPQEPPVKMNPFFDHSKYSMSSRDALTPGFMSRGNSNIFGFGEDKKDNSEADFDTADRYTYEFFHSDAYESFREDYEVYYHRYRYVDQGTTAIDIGQSHQSKKMLFIEIMNTLVLITEQDIGTLPYYWYVSKRIGRRFGRGEFYVYLRPFTFGFLNIIKERFDLAIYSSVDKEFLIFIMDILQRDKEFFNICITHEIGDEPKSISKFMQDGRSPKNTLLIDHDPEVWAFNADSSLPIPKFTGETKDSTLLYLEKYLIEMSDHVNVSNTLKKDFKNKILQCIF